MSPSQTVVILTERPGGAQTVFVAVRLVHAGRAVDFAACSSAKPEFVFSGQEAMMLCVRQKQQQLIDWQ
jgi:hypothetical protein